MQEQEQEQELEKGRPHLSFTVDDAETIYIRTVHGTVLCLSVANSGTTKPSNNNTAHECYPYMTIEVHRPVRLLRESISPLENYLRQSRKILHLYVVTPGTLGDTSSRKPTNMSPEASPVIDNVDERMNSIYRPLLVCSPTSRPRKMITTDKGFLATILKTM